jgi:hypothetical protein
VTYEEHQQSKIRRERKRQMKLRKRESNLRLNSKFYGRERGRS